MLIKVRRSWELRENQVTAESDYHNRRAFLKKAAGGSLLLGAGAILAACDDTPANASQKKAGEAALQLAEAPADPSAHLYPVKQNLAYRIERPLTPEEDATTYTNFYEFGSSKNIWKAAQALPIRPWTLSITGMVDKPFEIGIDDLLAKMPLEERLYRHRCVEAWSMTVPWSGFALSELVKLAQPKSGAKYVKFVTLNDPKVMPGQKASWYPWPYVEGLTIEEATNELAFISTGLYGKPIPRQNGAPLRVTLPWKYGFKSIKSIVEIEFTDTRPVSFWEEINAGEYGFWANVNPEVDHPRWSQATERVLGTNDRVPTQLYNGYGEQVAGLYASMKNEKLFK
ncbi:protein-methionine-sulfoxide reductase catalytic subunit MsrP [Rhodovibrionaceae bacterium A322]